MTVRQADVVRAAAHLIDEHGLAGLTLRAVAARLGVTAPTLYWHVRDKRHLLDLVAEHLLADLPVSPQPTPGEPVWEWLATRSRLQRGALLAHRDSAIVVAGNRPTAAALPRIEKTHDTLVSAGLTPGEALRLLTAVGSFILGDVLETQSSADRPLPHGPGWADRYPTAAAAVQAAGGDDDRFEEGLGLLMAGLQVRLEARRAAAASTDRDGPAAGNPEQLGEGRREHRVVIASAGPDLGELR